MGSRDDNDDRGASEDVRLEVELLGGQTRAGGQAETPHDGAPVVLIASRDPDMRAYVGRCLSKHEQPLAPVLEASDGPDALRLIRSRRPHLLILDSRLTLLDGFPLRERMDAETGGAAIRILLIHDPGASPHPPPDPAVRVLTMPFNARRLCDLVESLIADARQ